MSLRWRRAVLCASLVLAAPLLAHAQYFGRNTVQWERLQFEVLKTEHFDVYFYPEEKAAAEQAGRMAERWYSRLSRILRHEFRDRQPLILYASHPHFQQTNTVGGPPGEGTGGVTEAFKRRIVLPFGGSIAETDHVLGHELVHAFQYAMTGQGKLSTTNYPGALRMPLWFIEGMAEYLSVGPVDAHTAMWLRDAARREKLPTLKQLDSQKYFPYRWGQALWAYVAGRYGDRVVGEMLRAIGPRNSDAEEIFKEVLGTDGAQISKDWHAAIRDAYSPQVAGKKDPPTYGPALVSEKHQGGRLNLGPALSPDGNQLAFLSERELFSIELFVSDTRTGDVTRKLSRSVTDPHIESMQFINSSGAWDREGKRIALGAVAKGRPLLVIIDAKSGAKLDEISLPKLGEIFTPSWSPDGQALVFSASNGGYTDLFIYDLQAKGLRQLTDDAYADLQPAWSPDGHSIAFVTDRFSTKLPTLDTGNYRLAVIDPAGKDVRALPGFEEGKNINPQWSRDGKSLFFVSDRSGASNVYRLEPASGTISQLTDLLTGVSGITPLSPALSSAAAADRLAYSVYQDDRYEIYTIEDAERLAGWEVKLDATRNAGLIPGGEAKGAVLEATRDAEKGLADSESFETKPYKRKFGLDFIGQPYVTAGADRYGAVFAGGIEASFSDMLGQHSLDTMFQAQNVQGITDIGAMVAYVNRVHRFNWGAQVAQVPYITGGFAAGYTAVNGQPVYAEQTYTDREIEKRVAALGFYPFSHAMRFETSAGFRNISFKSNLVTDYYDPYTGAYLGNTKVDLPAMDSLNLFEARGAIVRDNSVFGATSPIMGQRLRFELSPTFGSVNYTGVLADFRKYFMPLRPLTIAARLMHYGRYGSGGEDPRFYPLFLGYPSMVRGWDTNSFSVGECPANSNTCPMYDQLFGSRLVVANLEARFPLFALFGARNLYGPVPIEVGAFLDAGVAWYSSAYWNGLPSNVQPPKPKFLGGEQPMVKSVGGTARVNLFGFAVLQFDLAWPMDRPGRGHVFQFNLLAGF
jgi:Tol biopolymer transport system component